MENEIFNKIEAFNYKYVIKNYSKSDSDNIIVDNLGKISLVRCETDNYDFLIKVITYDKFDQFIQNKIKENLLYDNISYNNSSIIVGESLSGRYNLSIGDTIILSDILNVNIVTGAYTSEKFVVANIFKFKFLNFDYENVFIKEKHNTFLMSEKYNSYIDYLIDRQNTSEVYNLKNKLMPSENEYSSLISSIKFEKKLYILLGMLTIVIASIMMSNNTLMVLFEKKQQFKLLNSLGMSLDKMLMIMLFCNLFLSVLLSTMGLLTTFIIEKMNIRFNIIDYFFIHSPFDTIPMNLSITQFIVTLLLIIILTAISTILSINNMKYRLEEE